MFDKETALFGIKAFEIMLSAGGVALVAMAARLARLPWYLMFAALPMLYQQHGLLLRMEAAALETGLYLLIPLAAVAMRNRWRASQDGIWALALLLVGVHMAYVMRIGGDHFEYRPLDFYWPLLYY